VKIYSHFFPFAIFLLVMAGCANHGVVRTIDNAQAYQQQLSQLTYWSLEGKIAVRHANKSDSAALQWQQLDENFDIFISGPLGTGATRITGNPAKLTLQNGDKISTTTDDPNHLIEKHLGWELPLENLPQWITGRSNHASARFNADNTLAGFEEHDWQVEYQRYQAVQQWLLPEKVVLKHEDMQVTIFIKHWDLQ
jgi:outer membrane lipoprotein LolB